MRCESPIFRTVVGLVVLLGAGTLWADIPDLEPGIKIKNGGVDLQVQLMSAPTSVDWNNDGAKDLIVGQETDGHIWLFLNQGTDLNPVFDGGSKIESNDTPITTTYS